MLVTLPEETPVNELVETAFSLEDQVGVSLGPVVVNGLYPDRAGLDTDPADAAEAAGASLRGGEADAARRRRRRSAATAPSSRPSSSAGSPSGCRSPSSASRTCSRPTSAWPSSTSSPTALLDGIGALPGPGAQRSGERAMSERRELDELVASSEIIICCGSGGVGKTTTAAVLALQAARIGRRAVVVTIDPAKRLADALGLEGLGNTPTRIEGDLDGELWAVMLDTKSTFDALVSRYASDDEQAERILANRFYRNISGALSGTQEYMAMEKLYELRSGGDFDLVVVDTPPTRHALDFLDAPRRLTRFLDHRLYRVLTAPTRGVMKAVNAAAQTFIRGVSKVVGADVFDDAIAFFQAFEGMEEGFKERAYHVLDLLNDPNTAFVLVASPRAGHRRGGPVLRRQAGRERPAGAGAHREPHAPTLRLRAGPRRHRERARTLAGTDLGELYANLADFELVAAREEEHLEGLAEQVAPAPVVRVPFLRSDVHDLAGLDEVGTHLFAS